MSPRFAPATILLLAVLAALPRLASVGAQTAPAMLAAGFSDPNRRAKLATAFVDIDRMFTEFAKTAHVPGAAWGSSSMGSWRTRARQESATCERMRQSTATRSFASHR